jgi:hypothetical protein
LPKLKEVLWNSAKPRAKRKSALSRRTFGKVTQQFLEKIAGRQKQREPKRESEGDSTSRKGLADSRKGRRGKQEGYLELLFFCPVTSWEEEDLTVSLGSGNIV